MSSNSQYNNVILNRKHIINDQKFLESAHKDNQSRIVVFDYALETYVDRLTPHVKGVVDRNYDQFIQKTKQVAVQIKKLQNQIRWEQGVFDQIDDDLDNQPVLLNLHSEIKKYSDIFLYYQLYMQKIQDQIQIEEHKILFLKDKYKNLLVQCQSNTSFKMARLVKYFRERLSLFKFSKNKSTSKSPTRQENRYNSQQKHRIKDNNQEFNDIQTQRQQPSLIKTNRNYQNSNILSQDQDIPLSERSHFNQQKFNNKNRQLLYSLEKQQVQKKPKMIFSVNTSPKTPYQIEQLNQVSVKQQQNYRFCPPITSSSIQQNYSVQSDVEKLRLISYSSPVSEFINNTKQNSESIKCNIDNTHQSQTPSLFQSPNQYLLSKGNKLIGNVSRNPNNTKLEKLQYKSRYEDNSLRNINISDQSYLFTPQKTSRQEYSPHDNRFKSFQCSPTTTYRQNSQESQNSFCESARKYKNDKNNSFSQPFNQFNEESDQNKKNNNLSLDQTYFKEHNGEIVNIEPPVNLYKIQEFDNTTNKLPQTFDDCGINDIICNKINDNIYKNRANKMKTMYQNRINPNYSQIEQESIQIKQELEKIQNELTQEKQKTSQLKNKILLETKNMNKIDSLLTESFKVFQKYVDKKIFTDEFNDQFCTKNFLNLLDLLEKDKKTRKGLFSQQNLESTIPNKENLTQILSEEDIEKITELEERSQNDTSNEEISTQQEKVEQSKEIKNESQIILEKLKLSSLSIQQIVESQQQQFVKQQEQIDNNPEQEIPQPDSIFNDFHLFDFQQLRPFQLFFLLIKDENLLGKFFLQNFLKRKKSLQIFSLSKQY